MIDGVLIHPLQQIPDHRGKVMHMLRADDPHFETFGEIYFSTVFEGVVKGWHLHKKMTLNYACVHGAVELGLYDAREHSPTKGETQQILLSPETYVLARVPPGVWNGFRGLKGESIVANCTTMAYDPDDIVRIDPRDPSIPYSWEPKHG